jgi:hypothetical protein
MATANQPYYDCIKRTLHASLCLMSFPSPVVAYPSHGALHVLQQLQGDGYAPGLKLAGGGHRDGDCGELEERGQPG